MLVISFFAFEEKQSAIFGNYRNNVYLCIVKVKLNI